MGNSERARQAQFELMVSFMERHGDIQYLSKLDSDKRWIEITDLLNNESVGEPKTTGQWRKCWSDFKNNTRRKQVKIKSQGCKVGLSKIEKRLLKIILENKKRKATKLDNESAVVFKPEPEPVLLIEAAPCEMSPSPVSPPQNCTEDVEYEWIDHRKSSSSIASETSNDVEDAPTREKRKKTFNMKDIAEQYIEFEREREKMAHEREMARIRQNDQLLTIFGKVVNVLERLTPNIQKYLDHDTDDDR